MNYISVKLQNLIVRACKSKNPEIRLRSIYKRFYCRELDNLINQVVVIEVMNNNMISIIQDQKLADLYSFYSNAKELLICNSIAYEVGVKEYKIDNIKCTSSFSNFLIAIFKNCINIIRWSEVSAFDSNIYKLKNKK